MSEPTPPTPPTPVTQTWPDAEPEPELAKPGLQAS